MSSSPRAIAIVGAAGRFPSAPSIAALWQRVVKNECAARDVSLERWAVPASDVVGEGGVDQARSTKACALEPFELDAPELGELPADQLSRLTKLTLQVGAETLRSVKGRLNRERTGVVLANIALPTDDASAVTEALLLGPLDVQMVGASLAGAIRADDVTPSALPAGVLARALGLGGGSYTLDAACASSLYAMALGCLELEAGRLDAVVAGGVSLPQALYTQIGFTQLQALSKSGVCAPYDRRADGLVVGEGAGMVVLKRLADAERDGDVIRAVIRGIGLSNDVGGSLLSPEQEGQERAMRAAYAQAGWEPHQVQLVEGHGTGTPRGDAVELMSLAAVWGDSRGACVLGSVKSNVGHLLTAAGVAGVSKVLQALEHQTLPPSANGTPQTRVAPAPFEVLSTPRPWLAPAAHPRRAAVSGFGFGGINAHLLLEEYRAGPTVETKCLEPAPVALVGLATHLGPLASVEAFGEAVLGGVAVRAERPAERWSGFGAQVAAPLGAWVDSFDFELGPFKIPPRELSSVLAQQSLMLSVAGQALVDAGWASRRGPQVRTGVVVGLGLDLESTAFHLRWLVRERARRYQAMRGEVWSAEATESWVAQLCDSLAPGLDASRTLGALGGLVPSRIARAFQLGGPSFAVAGDEGSGLRALEVGARLIQAGVVDEMVIGAIDFAGDLRHIWAGRERGQFSLSGVARPFEARADGSLVGEGAVALAVMRLEHAEAQGQKVYAVLRGLAAAGVGSGRHPDAPLRALAEALRKREQIGLVVAGASGVPSVDVVEGRALAACFAGSEAATLRDTLENSPSPAVHTVNSSMSGDHRVAESATPPADRELASLALADSLKSGDAQASEPQIARAGHALAVASRASVAVTSTAGIIGAAGAVTSLASVAHAALALSQQVLPPLAGFERPSAALQWEDTSLHVLREPQRWHQNRDGERAALVTSNGRDGSSLAAVLTEAPGASRRLEAPLLPRSTGLFLLRAVDGRSLERQQQALRELANAESVSIDQLARLWFARGVTTETASRVARAIVAADRAELLRQLEQPFTFTEALGGELAFVFPGSGNHWLGMGRSLALAFPQIYCALEAEVATLRDHLRPDEVTAWRTDVSSNTEARAYREWSKHTERVIVAQVSHGVAVADVVRSLGVTPQAYLGYSLGESVGLFASRTWRDRDTMFGRTISSELFRSQLAGVQSVIRQAWGEGARWRVVIVNRDSAKVRAALCGTAALLIVNAPGECVIGGDAPDVEATVAALGCEAIALESVPTVHLPVMKPVREAYRSLHLLPTAPPEGIRFYSGAWAKAYVPTEASAADSIVANAEYGFDFPQLIETAWNDGVRAFVELGPQGSCTRMISRILAGKPHLAVTADQRGVDGLRALLLAVGKLAEAGYPVDLNSLYGGPGSGTRAAPRERLTLRVGAKRSAPPAPPTPALAAVSTAAPSTPMAMTSSVSPELGRLVAMTQATAAAHEQFLKFSQQSLALQGAMLAGQVASPATTRAEPPSRPPCFDRDACLEFAIGSISKMLGPHFATVDTFPTRVRLPAEPLMLVDRIMEVEGELGGLGSGRVMTEHDVKPEAWYLDGGRAPVCISVEAGQADLFLSGYLGIDLRTKGERVYRLLDAKIVLHRDLPRAGEVIRYDIRIDRFICQGDTWLFFFRFDGAINGQPFITMFDGCAGFFSAEQLASGRGIVEQAPAALPQLPHREPFTPLLPAERGALDERQLHALRQGDLQTAFGSLFSGRTLARSLRLPDGRMRLVDRIVELDPTGGAAGLGLVIGEHSVSPDAWYLTCHFIDDHVMPGTLMYECCLHTLRTLLLRLGWVTDDESLEAHYSPVEGVPSQLKCRGQVTASTRQVTYRVEIREIGYAPEPYVIATASMFADGRHVVQMDNMSLKVVGLRRPMLEAMWKAPAPASPPPLAKKRSFTRQQIVAYAEGKPSECFGEPYRVFDQARRLARLPRDPFLFVDRVLSVDAEPWKVAAGGWVEAEFDVDPSAWFFTANQQTTVPFSVLLEAALQPCGWLAAYVGSALLSEEDLHFRNLDGQATQLREVHAATAGTLRTRARLTKASSSGGMVLEEFDFEVLERSGERIYQGHTGFGFFSTQALSQQVGVRGATWWPAVGQGLALTVARDGLALPAEQYAMIDTISALSITGGAQGLGFIEGTKRVNPEEWFFRAHFFQDPVMPGSLGLESLVQLLKVFARQRFGDLVSTHRFESMALGVDHRWQYRGQVIPTHHEVKVQATVTRLEEGPEPLVVADGQLSVDGRIIYSMKQFGLRLRRKP